MKGIKKNKQVLFLETEKRHADLKIKLKHYGITQSEFIRGCITGLIDDDEQFLPFFFTIVDHFSTFVGPCFDNLLTCFYIV